ncbi:ADP-ribosylation factor [Striga asiatica]|uniref:ADP-ribosylation factor n=1 Tax=Striga asiatica TaxID=4170 RepID=A0A5A7QJG2_STRAF|nr:ADP-ribosylation factor [Striga asiatica]
MAKVEDENYVSDTSSGGEGNLEQNHRKVEVQRRRRLVQKKIQFGKKNVQTKGVGEHSHVRCPITRSSAQKKRFSQKNAMERNGDANGKRKVKYPDDIDSDFEVEQCVPVDEEESEDSSEANKSVLRRSKGNTHRHKSSCFEFEDEDARNKHQREHKLLILTKIVAIYVDKQIMPLLDWELLFPNSRALVVKIINSNDNSRSTTPIADIKRLLSNDQLEVFRNSAFGKFIDLPHYKIQNQLVNLISLREVHQPRLDEMWFDFGGKIMRFGVEEFAVISGLNCAKPNDVPESSRHQENVGIHKEVDAEDFVQGNGEHNVDFDVDGFPVLTPQMMDEIDRTTEGKLKSMLTANKNDTPGVIGGLDIRIQGNQNVNDLVSVVDIPFKKIKRVKKRQVICKSCPFDTDFWDTMRFDLTSDLVEWLKVGKLKNRRKKKEGSKSPFLTEKGKGIKTARVATRPDTPVSQPVSRHIDVLFYYIRKIGLYALEPPSQKFTTTDNFFDQQMKSLYSLYIVNSCDPRICTIDSVIVDYMFGFKILCGESWLDVDYVLFPIHVELEGCARECQAIFHIDPHISCYGKICL